MKTIKLIIAFATCLLMTFQTLSQTTSIKELRVQILSNNKDTLIVFTINDSKIILTDLIKKEVSDSLVLELQYKDSLNNITLGLQDTIIAFLKEKTLKQEIIEKNLNDIIENKDKKINILKGTVSKQKTEIKKQKFYKIIGFATAIALPILVIIFL